jgi:UDP:flavonoid glycosyltransferase YjiC (YdhE family)
MHALFIPFAPSWAHVSRCLALAEAWRANGHTATFAIGPEQLATAQNAGFETRPVPEVSGAVFRTDRGFRWLSREYFGQNLQTEQSILADAKPDLVVFDFRFTTSSSARLAHLPSVSILHGSALRLALRPHETARLLIGDPRPARGISTLRLYLIRRLFPIVFQLVLRSVAHRFAPILKTHGLPPVNSLFDLLLGDEILLADIPDLLPSEIPSNGHVIGPLAWSGWDQPAPWLDEFDARPLIYVTMGSTVEAQSILVKIIEALRDAPYNIVVSTGHLSLPSDLDLPSHVRVFPRVPGATVMRRSAAVVHHGGHETLMQALAAGVPSLILPANPDQTLVAQQAQALGIGRSLWQPDGLPVGAAPLRKVTSVQIRRQVDDLIADHECARMCKTLKHKIEAYSGAVSAAKILEGIVKSSIIGKSSMEQ